MNRLILSGYKLLIILLFLLCINHSISQSHQLVFQHLSANEGFTSASVWEIFKDSKGFIWIGAADGLYRYDGYQFKKYLHDPADPNSISGNIIINLFEDNNGTLWVGTGSAGLNKYDRINDNFKCYLPNPDTSTNAVNGVFFIYQDKLGTLWIGTPTGGIHEYVDSTDSFNTYKYDTTNSGNFKNFITCVYEDDQGLFLLGTWTGLILFDSQKKQYSIPDEIQLLNNYLITTIYEDNSGTLWIGTYIGLFNYDTKKKKLVQFKPHENNQDSLSSLTVKDLFEHPLLQDPVFLIATDRGLNLFNTQTGINQIYFHNPNNPQSIAYNNIHEMHFDNGLLWLGSENSGISIANMVNTHYEYFHIDPIYPKEVPYNATTFLKDNKGHTWVGTAKGGLYKYDQEMNFVDHYTFNPEGRRCAWCNFIYSLIQTPDGKIWIGTVTEGLHLYDEDNNDLIHCKLIMNGIPLQNERINNVFKDSFGSYWIASIIGKGLFFQQPGVENITDFQHITQDPLDHIDVRDFYEDNNRNLWVATNGEGIYLLTPENRDSLYFIKLKTKKESGNILHSLLTMYTENNDELWLGGSSGLIKFSFNDSLITHYNSKNGLEADLIYDIEGDGKFLWLSTDRGLIRFNPNEPGKKKSKTMRFSDGVPFENIYTFDIYRDDDGMIYVGGKRGSAKGFYRFHPDNIIENQHIPPIVITDFQVKNKPFPLDSNITEKKHLVLKYNENYISFEFAALDYVNPEMNQYAYILEGVDDDWIQSGNRRFVNYTGISPGSYIFRVKGSNNDGIWNEEGTSIAITIHPPPWKTWWAYILYGIAISALLLALRWYDLKRQRLKQNLELEKVEKDKLGELDRMKSRFFANISHEFRTPLTLILGPLRNLEQETVSEKSKKDLNIIQRNALRLQQLINQLLSLSKLESGQMKLQARELNIVQLVKGYTHSFESLAKQKDIKLEFESETDELMLWVDQDKMEKILYNLLSNAFKYTGDGGRIEVVVSSRQYAVGEIPEIRNNTAYRLPPTVNLPEKYIVISVTDTGSGISADKLPHIFDRFYQIDETYKADSEGTGIGLALTKELVELHHGQIVGSSEKGVGSKFEVYLPLGEKKEEERREKREEKREIEIENELITYNLQPITDNIPDTDSDKPIILIVEDNSDLRTYIRGQLEDYYNIIEAKDGEQGLSRAIEHIPDLVLSDVMMPKMDGYELCKNLKTDEHTSHIPVILLTARASMESKLEGLETGADDFITKPFDPQELQVRVKNLIVQRRNLTEKLMKKAQEDGITQWHQLSDTAITSMEQQFLQKAASMVEAHISDPDFKTETFSREMALSHSQLYRKLHALIDQSPSEFIRTTRLQRAAQLLPHHSANISEIAYEVGFNNPSYFAECFKKQFGQSPSEYGKN